MSRINPQAIESAYVEICHDIDLANGFVRELNIGGYEARIRAAAAQISNVTEWILKYHLRGERKAAMDEGERSRLKQPNFHDLIILAGIYAIPPLAGGLGARMESFRNDVRNPGTHDAVVPSLAEVVFQAEICRELIENYVERRGEELVRVPQLPQSSKVDEMRARYCEAIVDEFRFLDLGGISPRVGNRIVKIQLSEIYVPVKAIPDAPLYERFSREAEADSDSHGEGELIVSQIPVGMSESEGSGVWESERLVGVGRILDHRRAVILGDPGSGKSTVARYAVLAIASGNASTVSPALGELVPIYVRASDYSGALGTRPHLSLYRYLVDDHSDLYSSLFEWNLRLGRCFLVLDGIDEIPDPSRRRSVVAKIEQFVSEFGENRLLVTSRSVGYRENQISGDFRHYTLERWDRDGIAAFLRSWFRAIEDEGSIADLDSKVSEASSRVMAEIMSNRGIARLAGNPLLLTIIALVHGQGKRLPKRRIELYSVATETLIENWPLRQGRGAELSEEEVLEVLQPVAFEILTSGNSNRIRDYELRPLIERKVGELRGVGPTEAKRIARVLLDTVQDKTGFFVERGFDDESASVYGFLHLTFAEYLAGRHLASRWSNGELHLDDFVDKPEWHEVLLLMAGHIGTWNVRYSTDLIAQVLKLPLRFDAELERSLFLAAEMLCDGVRVERWLFDQVAIELCRIVLDGRSVEQGVLALQRLREMSEVMPLNEEKCMEALDRQIADRDTRALRDGARLVVTGFQPEVLRSAIASWGASESHSVFFELDRCLGGGALGSYLHHNEWLAVFTSHKLVRWSSLSSDQAALFATSGSAFYGLDQVMSAATENGGKLPVGIHLVSKSEIADRLDEIVRWCLRWDIHSSRREADLFSMLSTVIWEGDAFFDSARVFRRHLASFKSPDECLRILAMVERLFEDAEIYLDSNGQRNLGTQEWVELMGPYVTSPDPRIRLRAFRVMFALLETDSDCASLIDLAFCDSSWRIRCWAAKCSAYLLRRDADLQDFDPMGSLVERLQDRSLAVRTAAATTIMASGESGARLWLDVWQARFQSRKRGIGRQDGPKALQEMARVCTDEMVAKHRLLIEVQVSDVVGSGSDWRDLSGFWSWSYLLQGLRSTERTEFTSLLLKVANEKMGSGRPEERFAAASLLLGLRGKQFNQSRLMQMMSDADRRVRHAAYWGTRSDDFPNSELCNLLLMRMLEGGGESLLAANALANCQDHATRAEVLDFLEESLVSRQANRAVTSLLWNWLGEDTAIVDIPF